MESTKLTEIPFSSLQPHKLHRQSVVIAAARTLGDGTVVVIETDLHTAAHGSAVDGSHGGEGQLHEALEDGIAAAADLNGLFAGDVLIDVSS